MKIVSMLLVTLICGFVTLGAAAADQSKPKSGKLLHVVSFKFKNTATPEQIQQVVDAFHALPKQIKQIKSFEWGTNVSPEKHDKGFTHGFVLSFKTARDRDAYLVHPAHKAFGESLHPILDDVFVIDFWAQK